MKYEEYLKQRADLENKLVELDVNASINGPEFIVVEKKYKEYGEIVLVTRYLTINEGTCRVNEEHLKDLNVGEYYLVESQICYVRIK